MFPILRMRDTYLQDTPNTIGTLARVSKVTARKLYDKGHTIIVVPHKMMPHFRADSFAMRLCKVDQDASDISFDTWLSYYINANCDYEVGYYPAFYVRYNHYIERPLFSGKFYAE